MKNLLTRLSFFAPNLSEQKKISKPFLKFVVLVALACIVASCSIPPLEGGKIIVNDPLHYLSYDLKDSLLAADIGLNTRLVVLDSVPFGTENALLDSLMTSDSVSALIVASAHPTYVFVRLEDNLQGSMSAALEHSLGSADYYQLQLSDSLDLNQKVVRVINQLYNTESVMIQAQIYEYIKGEILGPLYSWSAADGSRVYRYLYYPFQRPFVWMINLTGNYFLGLFLGWLLLMAIFVLSIILINLIIRATQKRPFDKNDKDTYDALLLLFEIIFFNIPIFLGVISLGVQVSNAGLEYSHGLVENIGLSYEVVNQFYHGFGPGPSVIITIIAFVCAYISLFNAEDKGKKAIFISTALYGIALASSAAFAWAVFIVFLKGMIGNLSATYKAKYTSALQTGISKIATLGMFFVELGLMALGAFLGNWFVTRSIEIVPNRFEVPSCEVRQTAVDNPRPQVDAWYVQFE